MSKIKLPEKVPTILTTSFYKLFFKNNTLDFLICLYIMDIR